MRPRNRSNTDESQALVFGAIQNLTLGLSLEQSSAGLQAAMEQSLNAHAVALSGPWDQVQLSAGQREGYLLRRAFCSAFESNIRKIHEDAAHIFSDVRVVYMGSTRKLLPHELLK